MKTKKEPCGNTGVQRYIIKKKKKRASVDLSWQEKELFTWTYRDCAN